MGGGLLVSRLRPGIVDIRGFQTRPGTGDTQECRRRLTRILTLPSAIRNSDYRLLDRFVLQPAKQDIFSSILDRVSNVNPRSFASCGSEIGAHPSEDTPGILEICEFTDLLERAVVQCVLITGHLGYLLKAGLKQCTFLPER